MTTHAGLLLGLLTFSLPLALFCTDWDNRFVLPALVFILILAALGLDLLPLNPKPFHVPQGPGKAASEP
jgi:hypothetical protein